MNSNIVSKREWRTYGPLWDINVGGINCLNGTNWLDPTTYIIATIRDGMYLNSNLISNHILLSYDHQNSNYALAGMYCIDCNGGIAYSWWTVATLRCYYIKI